MWPRFMANLNIVSDGIRYVSTHIPLQSQAVIVCRKKSLTICHEQVIANASALN